MRLFCALVVMFSIFVPAIRCVNWSTLTISELEQLPCSDFLNITSEELGSIPASAMIGLSDSKVNCIPYAAASGFTADQLSKLWWGACGALNESHVLYITPEAFSGIDFGCVRKWSEQVWAVISKEQVSHFSKGICIGMSMKYTTNISNKVQGISVDMIWWLNPASISGLTSGCAYELESCRHFNSTLFGLLSLDAISNLTWSCFSDADQSVLSQATAAQMSALPPILCNRLTDTFFPYINYDGIVGMTPQCIANLTDASCRLMNGTWLSHLALDSVTALTPGCIVNIPADATLSILNGDFFHALDPLSCSSWSAAQSEYFTAKAASGIRAQCLGNFTTQVPNGACSELTAEFVGGLSTASFNGFTVNCIRTIPPASFKDITRDQLQGINSTLCSTFSIEQVRRFPSKAASGMQAQCLAKLNQLACTGLQGEFVANMKSETFKGLTTECVQHMSSETFTMISAKQVESIPVTTFSVLSDIQIDALTNEAIQGTTVAQLQSVSSSGFDGFTMAHFAIIIRKYGLELVTAWTIEQTRTAKVYEISHFKELVNNHNFAKLSSWGDISGNVSRATWIMIALLKDEPQPRLDAETIKALAPSAAAGLRADHIKQIAGKDFQFFTHAQGSWFTDDQVTVFTAAQVKNMAAKTFAAMNFMVISSLRAELIAVLSSEQIQALPALNIEFMTCDQLNGFNHDQTSHFGLEQQVAYETAKKQCKGGDLLIPLADNEPYPEATSTY